MKFFSKYKKQILSVFLCVTLFSCFMGFSFSSSAADVSGSIPISDIEFWAVDNTSSWYGFATDSDGTFSLSLSGDISPQPFFRFIYLSVSDVPPPPSVDGRITYLSLSVDLDVLLDSSLRWASQNGGSVLSAAAFRNCQFFIGETLVPLEAYVLRDADGVVVDHTSESFWASFVSSGYTLQVDILVDITDYLDQDLWSVWFYFPSATFTPYLWASSYDTVYRIKVDSVSLDYLYRPFNDVVQDDLSDIKGSLSGVNNKLDSLNSTMNTIDQDINRVNLKLDQTNETLGNIDQGIQDILKPSIPSVDFKNQWNDYFVNNPIPDISNLPFYDMSNLMTLLADSSQVIRGIFSPFFLRDYQVTVPLVNGFSNIKLDPVATYVSLSFALSLSILIIVILKGSRG